MKAYISRMQLNHLASYILDDWETYSPQVCDGKRVFDKLEKINNLVLFQKKPIITFKKILLPNKIDVKKMDPKRKIAFLGLNNCDVWALHRFLKEFEHTSLLPERKNILIIGTECTPDQFCFCDQIGTNETAPFDLFIQDEKGELLSIFSGSGTGTRILNKLEIKAGKSVPKLKEIPESNEKSDFKEIFSKINDRETNKDFWQGIADNCFGCGACTAVCPLCFCTKQVYENGFDGKSAQCLYWDSCFAKRFSEVQNHYDLRPDNVDRLYNWYHHKFVRAKFEYDHFLCTGCGRCIEACPANLNIKNILRAITEKKDK